uniref:NADH-ubiquinone oxidoreductase chain 5 n=1 Tax=Chrysolagria sp. CHR01 TaxID=1205615 RepID=A0A0S2MP72_9CUCU|nr:NADH deshydrogenase subunit 5 [Chrysolagria sp. CHR01]
MICINFFILFVLSSISLFSVSMFFFMINKSIFIEIELLSLNSSSIMMTLIFDWMSLIFLSFVLFISSMVILYSKEYMKEDINIKRFIFMVFMFVMSMMILILSPNLISILLGWDGLGLVSYCLVIYYQNHKSFNAGMLTALMNRVGDVALLISIAWMINFGSWNFIFYINEILLNKNLLIISLMISLAAFTKSAQIPFSSWLPAAMAAPTPVSALVHSSTLVTAGVYLMIRFIECFNKNLLLFLLLISVLTMIMSGLGASFEFDLKKIIALSTLSQLGLMFSILFLMEKNLALFHLLTHALFKALLFMCAGNLIHNFQGCQDIRFMSSSVKMMPLTCSIFNISNFSLCGIPFLSGFYSKDLIMESMSLMSSNLMIYLMFFLSIGLTTCYSFRLFVFLYFVDYNFYVLNSIKENLNSMLMAMLGLIFPVIIMGTLMSWLIFNFPYLIVLSFKMKILTLMMVLSGLVMGFQLSKMDYNYSFNSMIYDYNYFFSSMWNLTLMFTKGIISKPIFLSNNILNVDKGWLENFGCQNIYHKILSNSKIYQLIFNNNIKTFLMMFLLILLILMF